MDASTVTLHETLIRLAKGMISAWEAWVRTRTEPIRSRPKATSQ